MKAEPKPEKSCKCGPNSRCPRCKSPEEQAEFDLIADCHKRKHADAQWVVVEGDAIVCQKCGCDVDFGVPGYYFKLRDGILSVGRF